MMDVLFFPGKNIPIKRYRAYFPKAHLVTEWDTPTVILCHSRGIEAALECKTEAPIVAMDPTFLSNSPRVYHWIRRGRDIEIPKGAQVTWYDAPTHYPYQVKALRDKIWHQLVCLSETKPLSTK